MMSQPNRIFIVGSMKSGTTSLHDYLISTGEVFSPIVKEPQFITWEAEEIFKVSGNDKKLWDMVVPIKSKNIYEEIYSEGEGFPYLIDSSVFNLPSAASCNYIKMNYPYAKIIILVRDPVARMISSYNFQRSKGVEKCATLEEAIKDELQGGRVGYPYSLQHVFVSRYAQQIPLYIESFDNVLILSFNDLINDLPKIRGQIKTFLDLDIDIDELLPKSNETMGNPTTRFGALMSNFIFTDNNIKHYLKLITPVFFRRYFSKILKVSIRRERHAKLSPTDILELRKIFFEDYKYLKLKFNISFD